MEELPHPLIIEILSRLGDTSELVRCRLVSRTLNSLSREVPKIHLLCTLSRYLKSRAPETEPSVTPFKTIIISNLVLHRLALRSVSIGVEKSLGNISYDDEEGEFDDLYLTDVGFVNQWLPNIGGGLKSLSVSDFWIQSCCRKSEILSLISSYCHSLLELQVKNAFLSVDGLKPMPMLTSLTLEYIRLDDEDLHKVNHCFPYLKVLNLIGVGGLKEPKIHLLHLNTCLWTVSNAPLSLTILAPKLVKLNLKCIKPRSLVLETPLLSNFHLALEEANEFKVKEFPHLKNFKLESVNLCSLISMFPSSRTVKKLRVDSMKLKMTGFNFDMLFDVFPNLSYLHMGSGAWKEIENYYHSRGMEGRRGMKRLKEIVGYLVEFDYLTFSFIFSMLDNCTNLSDMALVIHKRIDNRTASGLISKCRAACPRVRWKRGMWMEGTEDLWVSEPP